MKHDPRRHKDNECNNGTDCRPPHYARTGNSNNSRASRRI